MKVQSKIIYVAASSHFDLLQKEIQMCLDAGISSIRLMEHSEITNADYLELLTAHKNVDFILSTELEQRLGRKSNIVFYELSKWDSFIRTEGQVVIARAYSIVDCKNWELKKVDFIDFSIKSSQPVTSFNKSLLGTEGLTALIPKQEEYGWMVISLNTPVFVSDVASLDEIETITEHASVYGVVIDPTTFLAPVDKELIVRIQELLD